MREIGYGDREEIVPEDAPDDWGAYLGPGERLLWTGAPETGIKFRKFDWVMIPFGVMWTGFALYWEYAVLRAGAPWFMALLGLPLILAGLFLLVGRFQWDAYARARTRYALTSERVVAASAAWGRQMVSLALSRDLPIVLEQDVGAVRFGTPPQIDFEEAEDTTRNMGKRRMKRRPGSNLVFEFIGREEARRVYDLARRAVAAAGE